MMRIAFLAAALLTCAVAFHTPAGATKPLQRRPPLAATKLDPELEATTKKWGLEGGLFSIWKSDGDGKGDKVSSLFKEYGVAYLITSITLALISFGTCYFLVDLGVDVGALLAKVNIDVTATTEKAGTAAIAYAAHKATSPLRFPPTVALTTVVAKFLKKGPSAEESAE